MQGPIPLSVGRLPLRACVWLQVACVGVTTGQLLCACVGSRDRAEYTVYGDAINLSARLMMKAAGGLGSVLCDKATFSLAPTAASFFKLDPLKVSCSPFCARTGGRGQMTANSSSRQAPNRKHSMQASCAQVESRGPCRRLVLTQQG